jgi:hypothetical protein
MRERECVDTSGVFPSPDLERNIWWGSSLQARAVSNRKPFARETSLLNNNRKSTQHSTIMTRYRIYSSVPITAPGPPDLQIPLLLPS